MVQMVREVSPWFYMQRSEVVVVVVSKGSWRFTMSSQVVFVAHGVCHHSCVWRHNGKTGEERACEQTSRWNMLKIF